MIHWRQRPAFGSRGRCERQHRCVEPLAVVVGEASFEVLQLRVLLRRVVRVKPVRVGALDAVAFLVLEDGFDAFAVLDVGAPPVDGAVPRKGPIFCVGVEIANFLPKRDSIAFGEGLFSRFPFRMAEPADSEVCPVSLG